MSGESARPGLSRRAFVQGTAATVLLGGCSVSPLAGSGPAPSPPGPVDVPGYAILPGEVLPACKTAAVRAVEAALTWRDGESSLELAQERLAVLGVDPAALTTASPLFGKGVWSSVEIGYPQYSGLLADDAAAGVMIIGEQLVPGPAAVERTSFILDVRLAGDAEEWTTTQVLLGSPPPAASPTDTAVAAVLENDRIRLPTPARGDLLAGTTDDVVISMLNALAETWRLDVHVLRTGHPDNVFGTDRLSNHTRGRAVDIWAIDDVPVIDQQQAAWEAVMTVAADLGATEIGGPVDLDGVRGQRPYFSDDVHQDHLHLGFEVT